LAKQKNIFLRRLFISRTMLHVMTMYICMWKKWNQEWNIDWNKRVKKKSVSSSHGTRCYHLTLISRFVSYCIVQLLSNVEAIKLNDSMKILLCFDIIDLMHDYMYIAHFSWIYLYLVYLSIINFCVILSGSRRES
jgi:hypothetical protein